jgi:hypothetical protein
MRWIAALSLGCAMFPALARADVTAGFTATRVDGVAPLAVYFEAGPTTCDSCPEVVDPWHDLAYSWDFDDPDAGVWPISGRSKARDIGPAAAHVFERPGHYEVTLTATDPVSGETGTITTAIDVADPDQEFAGDATLCYRASDAGDFAGCPAGAQQKTMASFNAAFSDCDGADRRCLLRRGDTFVADDTVFLGVDAPQILGAFGDGPAPTIDASGIGPKVLFQGAAAGDDWRVMDLRFIGPGVVGSVVFFGRRSQRDVLVLRTEAEPDTWHNFVLMDASQLDPKDWHEGVFIVENRVLKAGFGGGGMGGNVAYIAFKNSAFLGNDFEDTRTGEHILRAEAYDNLLIAHNRLGPASSSKSVITLRSWDQKLTCEGTICGPSRRGTILANTLQINNGWTVQACGKAGTQDNQCEDNVVDGNFAFLPDAFPINNKPILIFQLADGETQTRRSSFRNNICDLTGLDQFVPACAELRVGSLARAVNNTCSRTDGGPLKCVRTTGQTSDGVSTIARNNLAFSTGMAEPVEGDFATVDSNLGVSESPFVSVTPAEDAADYQLADGSPAVDAGAPVVGNAFDFAGRARPFGPANDIGAWEFGAIDDPTGDDTTTTTTTGDDSTDSTGDEPTTAPPTTTDDTDDSNTVPLPETDEGGGSNSDTNTTGDPPPSSSDPTDTNDATDASMGTTGATAGTDDASGCACNTTAPVHLTWLLALVALPRRRLPRKETP